MKVCKMKVCIHEQWNICHLLKVVIAEHPVAFRCLFSVIKYFFFSFNVPALLLSIFEKIWDFYVNAGSQPQSLCVL